MNFFVKILCLLPLLAYSAVGQGTIIWDEAVNGPLSENGSSPTLLGSLVAGTNTILGSTEIEPTGNNWLVHEDIFTFLVPSSGSLSAIYITVNKSKVGSWIGDTGFSSPLGYTANSLDGDLLLQWGIPGVVSGSYGMYLGNYDPQPFPSVANYRLDFFVQSVPEPSTFLFGLVAMAGLLGLRQFKRR